MNKKLAVIIIRNSQEQLFVHQRSENKKPFPLLYGLGAGGKFEDGETPEQAASRELEEELGLKNDIQFLFNFDFESNEATHTIYVFQMLYDEKIEIREEHKFQWSGWLTISEVDQLAKDKKLCPDTEILYRRWKEEYIK